MKRIVSLILCAVLVMGMLPSIAFAATTVASGTCGDNLTWVLDSNGKLIINGNGDMLDYTAAANVPWYDYRSDITSISLPQELLSIGDYAFNFCSSMTRITIPEKVSDIGKYAVYNCSNLSDIVFLGNAPSIGLYAFYLVTANAFYAADNLTWDADVKQNYGGTLTWNGYIPYEILAESNTDCELENNENIKLITNGSMNNLSAVYVDDIKLNSDNYVVSEADNYVIIYSSYLNTLSEGWHRVTIQFGDGYASCIIKLYGVHNHNYTLTEVADATCSEQGYSMYTCTICGGTNFIYTEALGHSWQEATCTLPKTCTVCNQTEEDALGHSWDNGVITKEPTEESEGAVTYTCTRCNETKTEVIPKIEHVHSYTSVIIAPTCSEQGYTTYTCSSCGHSYQSDYVGATGHTWENATCTAPKTCRSCGQTEGNALGHTWTQASCTNPKTCTTCGTTEGNSLGHDWLDASCTTPKTCSRCSLASGTALGHNYVDGICTRCGEADSGYEPPKPTVDGVYRIAGADRIETSIGIANALKETLGVEKFSNIVVASALNFPDALAGSYLAALKDAPILLTYDAVHAKIAQYIADNLENHGTVYILGGEGAVSKKFEYELSARVVHFERVAGNDRFSTNMRILETAKVPTGSTVLVCTALNFADSLSVSATGLPILLVHGSLRPDQMVFLNMVKPESIYVVGGASAVSDATMKEIKDLLPNATLERIWGENRHVTSATVATEFFPDAKSAVVAYSRNFPDGLCGGPLAYALGAPLLLTVSGDKTPNAYTDYYEINAGYVLGSGELVNDPSVRSIFHMSTADPIN